MKTVLSTIGLLLVIAFVGGWAVLDTHAQVSWYDSSWQYRKSHTIQGGSGAGTGYQKKVIVKYGSGTDSGNTVYLNGNANNDFSDLRFTSDDGTTELDYWIQEKTDDDTATVWIKVKDSLNSDQDIYLYYGNANASDQSDGEAVFELFDNFESYSDFSDMSNEGWMKKDGTTEVITDNGSKVAKFTPGSSTNWQHYLVFGDTSLAEYILEMDYKTEKSADGAVYRFQDDNNWLGTEHYNVAKIRGQYNDSEIIPCGGGSSQTTGVYNEHKYLVKDTYLKHWINGNLRFEADSCLDSYSMSSPYKVGVVAHDNYGPVYVDNIRVRKHATTEPTHGSWGNQEEESGQVVMESSNYQIQRDSINSGGVDISTSSSYALKDTVGEQATGRSTSTNYTVRAGYRQIAESSIAVSALTSVTLPSLGGVVGGTSETTADVTVITDSPGGYELTVRATTSPALASNEDSFADYAAG
ncbi:MAG: hypothetical protein BRC25_03530, partial [Parcubacteria group bacterium SW_6_46_9]